MHLNASGKILLQFKVGIPRSYPVLIASRRFASRILAPAALFSILRPVLTSRNSADSYLLMLLLWFGFCLRDQAGDLTVGAASAELQADDSMIIAGGITAGKASGQEGKLRCIATVLEKDKVRLAIVACDVLMMTRQSLDPVVAEIEQKTGIPAPHILINCTHTHHAPSTMRVHDYGPDEIFTRRVQRGIVEAVQRAATNQAPCQFYFALGEEKTVGQNSRVLLDDGQIFWIGPRTNFVRPTGPFDPELPVFAFRDEHENLRALIFNHSTHSIGTREPGKRSASIYGLAAQDLEKELGGTVLFLEGASGSTHNLELSGAECTRRITEAVRSTLSKAQPREVLKLAALKHTLTYRVRHFDEAAEDAAVERYCRKYAPGGATTIIEVFRKMRRELAPMQGQERQTWVQVLRIGDVAIVGVPAEYFTQLGLDIKNRSPFRYTYIAELANDWIGYLPNLEGHKLGGYQVWTGYHSYAEPGTGEKIADEAVSMLHEIAK
jgi:neutral ceramidase